MEIIIAIIFGAALATVIYETYFDKKEKKVQTLLAPKAEELIEVSSMKIAKKQYELERELTEEEKNKILDECYSEL